MCPLYCRLECSRAEKPPATTLEVSVNVEGNVAPANILFKRNDWKWLAMALCTACLGTNVLPTQDADDLYNGLRKTEQIAGLFHRTY
ncbi:hypothetical protein [Methylocystis hirsuta]|uniref:Uncharacterized protein n=1 Tax=Methylocystis hirsuta TaxID=369798 RepID=A0A3M9XKG3_9HYPH|nr:hypothetical protein [Methylocystis hirsuta]RNJ48122.1 hypothetical protein D1O30_20055 [Methylocystis hirsuta]